MTRIPEHEIERLKQEVSVQRLAEARGIKLDRHGVDLIGPVACHKEPGRAPEQSRVARQGQTAGSRGQRSGANGGGSG